MNTSYNKHKQTTYLTVDNIMDIVGRENVIVNAIENKTGNISRYNSNDPRGIPPFIRERETSSFVTYRDRLLGIMYTIIDVVVV